jgi:putative ABC transport system substrate-binding protein
MNRRAFLIGSGAAISPVPPARAQSTAGVVYRVGYLTGGTPATRAAYLAAFREGMEGLGHREGQSYILIARGAGGRFERLPILLSEVLGHRPDVLFVTTTPANMAVKKAAAAVPVVFATVADPVGVGLVASLARPGSNTTGVTNIVVELTGKRLELLKEAIPAATRIAIFVNPDDNNARLQLHDAAAAASVLGMSLKPIRHIRRADDLDEAFRAATQARAHAVLRMVDPTVGDLRRRVGELALRYRLPVMCSTREEIEAGGLIAYGVPLAAQYRQAARLVHKVLQGARPANLPIERATGFELAINLRTAKTLGLKMPDSLLAWADKVIE